MADPRSEAITAIRQRLLDVPLLWPVKYHGMDSTFPEPQVSYIEETFAGGNEVDAGVGKNDDGQRTRQATENYQLLLKLAPNTDIRAASEMGATIARTFMDDTLETESGWPLWFSSYRLSDRGRDSGWQIFVLVLTYSYIFTA